MPTSPDVAGCRRGAVAGAAVHAASTGLDDPCVYMYVAVHDDIAMCIRHRQNRDQRVGCLAGITQHLFDPAAPAPKVRNAPTHPGEIAERTSVPCPSVHCACLATAFGHFEHDLARTLTPANATHTILARSSGCGVGASCWGGGRVLALLEPRCCPPRLCPCNTILARSGCGGLFERHVHAPQRATAWLTHRHSVWQALRASDTTAQAPHLHWPSAAELAELMFSMQSTAPYGNMVVAHGRSATCGGHRPLCH